MGVGTGRALPRHERMGRKAAEGGEWKSRVKPGIPGACSELALKKPIRIIAALCI